MTPKIYYDKTSAPSRAVLLTIRALDIDVDLESVNLLEKEQLNPQFLKINPQHTLPTLEDNGFVVWDSHSISAYLVGKYEKDDSLYSRNLEKRAVIDQRLHFDSGILYPRLASIVSSILKERARSVSKDKADQLVQGYTILETLLEGKKFVADEQVSIADLSIVATISTANFLVPLATNRFPNILEWFNRMQTLPYYQKANQDGLNLFITAIKSKMI